MMSIKSLLKQMVERDASDVFYRAGGPPRLRIDGNVVAAGDKDLSVEDLNQAVEDLATPEQRQAFKKKLDVDFGLYLEGLKRRFRVSIFMQRNCPSIVIRNIRDFVATFEELNLPADILKNLSLEKRGVVLLTGSVGSGKSTTLASMMEYMNSNCNRHVLTVEEPIEFTFKDKNCIINQRELGVDVTDYETALRGFTLQSPDVIYIANIRDQDTMSAAITAGETGVLVLSTLHTVNAAQTVERIINFFPPHQHHQVRMQLSYLLKGVVSLRLVPLKSGTGRVPAYEVMLLTPTISRLIREDKIFEIPKYIEDGSIFGMQSFNQSLVRLVQEEKISKEQAMEFADSKEEFSLALKGISKR
ncbi:type IV pilus twitching motility protein PilT [Candidatus Omnitrophota bacterium]